MLNLKQLILDAAILIMGTNPTGKVSNLEIKNKLRSDFGNDPSKLWLTQQMVSDTMDELANEHNWGYELNRNTPGVTYREYFDPTVDTQATIVSPAIAGLPNSTTVPLNFGPQLDPTAGGTVAYVSGQPDKFVQGVDRRTARHDAFNAFKGQIPNLDYDNINNCSVEYFNKRYMSSSN